MPALSRRKLTEIEEDKHSNRNIDHYFNPVIPIRRERQENDSNAISSSQGQQRRAVRRRIENDTDDEEENVQQPVQKFQATASSLNHPKAAVLSSIDNRETPALRPSSSKGSDVIRKTENNEDNADKSNENDVTDENSVAEAPLTKRRVIDENADVTPPHTPGNESRKVPVLVSLSGLTGGIYDKKPGAAARATDSGYAEDNDNNSTGGDNSILNENLSCDKDDDEAGEAGEDDDLIDLFPKTNTTSIKYKPIVITQNDLVDNDSSDTDSVNNAQKDYFTRRARSLSPNPYCFRENSNGNASCSINFFEEEDDEETGENTASSPFVPSDAEFSISVIEPIPNLNHLQPQRPTLSALKDSTNTLLTGHTLSPADSDSPSQVHVPLAFPRGKNILEKLGLDDRQNDDDTDEDEESPGQVEKLEAGNLTDDDDLPLDF
ncbi:hypothetical protein BDF20DRAFT_916192 [Mycotypha africana]|uniref:uncharacterized protein n=1 Tax=Mycotypha africana TaxID=64632 RepID=UPI002300BAC3|nr:uncharacterized protein BDF20DRAFT_916192 [Mycotypha africana]KAI8970380.1 hypothetical protein BDF20DRAFT_916192 [Mycotypha africana]